MAQRSFDLSGELSARLDEVAAETGQSADEIVRAALEQRLEQIEEELNDGLLERIAERLQEVDYAATAEAAIERIAASETSPDPLAAITSKRSERAAGVQLQNWDVDAAAGLLASERMVVGTLGTDLEGLTLREQRVLALRLLGCSDDQLALMLGISPQTAKTRVANLMHKLRLAVGELTEKPDQSGAA